MSAMSKSSDKVPRSINFTEDLLKRIDKEAERQRRNRSDFVRLVMEDYLDRRTGQRERAIAAAA